MKIERLYIGDFGILRNQTMENIHPGIVVIGGLNRAGKSTFMEVLRYLGYGFPKGRGLPPASGKYEAEADIRFDVGDVYNLRLSGHGEPAIKRLSGDRKEIINFKELYGLDNFTYRQLFTITLDELQKNHDISSGEKRRLQSVLLGAGFKDMLIIPQLEQEFYKEGDKIGGKRGSPKVKQFKPYYNSIEKGIKLKDKALGQVDEYREKQDRLKEKEKTVDTTNREIEELKNRVIQLDVIKNNYEVYLNTERLEKEIQGQKTPGLGEEISEYELEKIKSLRDEYHSLKREYMEKELQLGINANFRERLIQNKKKISQLIAAISGMDERIRQHGFRGEEYKKRKQDLTVQIKNTNSSWDEKDIENIARIQIDHIKYNSLLEKVERYRSLESDFKNHVDTLNRLESEYKILATRTDESEDGQEKIKALAGTKKYFYSSLVFILLGVVLFFIKPFLGALFGFGGIMITAVYFIFRALASKGNKVVNINKDLDYKQAEIEAEKIKLDNVVSEIDIITRELDRYKDILGLAHDISYNVLPGYFERVRDIQNKIWQLEDISHEIEEDRSLINDRLDEYVSFVRELSSDDLDALKGDYKDLEVEWNKIALVIKELDHIAENAKEIEKLEIKIGSIEENILQNMDKYQPMDKEVNKDNLIHGIQSFVIKAQESIKYRKLRDDLKTANQTILYAMRSDGVRRGFDILKDLDHGDSIDAFKKKCLEYSSEEEIQQAYLKVSMDLKGKNHYLEELKEDIQRIEDDLSRLATIENLAQGQRQIDNARSELKVLADQYAINMIASFLLKEAGNSLLEGMKDSIMDSAGNIFNQMTGGYYKGILPSKHLLEGDFEAILKDETSPETIDMLSRGTREQLYMSVRISRIMDIKPNLPIIIDDSFANFDSMHLGQSINILSDLSKTHQIFVLTCHGELVDKIAKAECLAQFWKLEEGRLEVSGFDELVGYLK